MSSNRCFGMGAGVAVVIALVASQALAYVPVPLKLTYSVELGGDNHAAAWKAGTRELYSGNSSTPGTLIYNTDPVNWTVLVKAEGDHLGKLPGTETYYYRTYGAANAVFNVELHQGTESGPLANGAVFTSTINDGTGTDPVAASAFAVSFQTLSSTYPPGRLIDTLTANGPRMEPIFTYPYFNPAEAKLIGMGAGYKEWVRTGGNLDLVTFPGVGMDQMPTSVVQDGVGALRAGLGVVPIAEGQIDVSSLPAGTYVLKVVPGKGNNVLRGDMSLLAATNRPAFAIGVPDADVVGGSISFVIGEPLGIKGRYVFYNNSAWDGNTPGIVVPGDYNAIAPDKTALLQGHTGAFANYISYSRSINGIMVDALNFNRLPEVGTDIFFVMGNAQGDPTMWPEAPAPNAMVLRPGEGVGGSDRLIITWADGAIPNTKWLLVAIFADDPSLGLPESDAFMFGIAMGESGGNFVVEPADEIGARLNPHTSFNKAPITDVYDYDRNKLVEPADQIFARTHKTTTFNCLKAYIFNPIW